MYRVAPVLVPEPAVIGSLAMLTLVVLRRTRATA